MDANFNWIFLHHHRNSFLINQIKKHKQKLKAEEKKIIIAEISHLV